MVNDHNMKQDTKPNLKLINKQMLEIKKKIQLSEGRRRATFEDCENEGKSNQDEVARLKKEIAQLVAQLGETKKAGTSMLNKRLETIIGPLDEKAADKVQELIDLQITDKLKLLSLVHYKIKQHQSRLNDLGKEYQELLFEKSQQRILQVVDRPIKKMTCDLQNSIHAVKVQLREANHICVRYKDLRGSLSDDASKFRCNIAKIEEELETQRGDINRLQQVMDEATRMKSSARIQLLDEEKAAMAAANLRNRQITEGKQLVTSKKQELEMLEKRIFQGGKTPAIRTDPDGIEDGHSDEEGLETPNEETTLIQALESLKKATGGTDTQEVLKRFSDQKDTSSRLLLLRKKSAMEKKQLEKELAVLNSQLEHYKFVEFKEMERKTSKIEHVQRLIETQRERSRAYKMAEENKNKSMKSAIQAVLELYHCLDPLAVPGANILDTFKKIKEKLMSILSTAELEEPETENDEEKTPRTHESEEKVLSTPYIGLIKRTPLPQQGFSPTPLPVPGSEDEEDVPSRTYLKRQAQLVVDAKSRRKNVRMLPRRN